MANIQTNPWTFTNADQAVSKAITSITRQGIASALVNAAAHGFVENQAVSIQGATIAGYNGGYRVKAVVDANNFLIALPDWKSNLANSGAAGNALTVAYLDLIRAEQMLWDTDGPGPLLITNLIGNIEWNPHALAANQGPYTYGKTFFVEGLVINTLPSGVLQMTIV